MVGTWSEAWGYEAVAQLFGQNARKPDAVFCGNDQIARGVVDALRERGIGVPDDVAVVDSIIGRLWQRPRGRH